MIRTTNLLERLFGEERRRTKVIPHAFGERPVLKLMYEFELKQIEELRSELDQEFKERTASTVKGASHQRIYKRGI